MKKFVVAFAYEWSSNIVVELVPTLAKNKRQAIQQAEDDAFGSYLARQFGTSVLFCETLTPQMEASIIQNYYDAVIERTDLYFNEDYPIGGYYESKLYRADERVYAISTLIHTIMPDVNLN